MSSTNIIKANKHFADECLLYYSRSDSCWIAHSLHTDQIGIGTDVITALSKLIEVISSLIIFSKTHQDTVIHREAPIAIQKRIEKAVPLPNELCEIAYKRTLGEWPKEIKLLAEPTKKRALIAKITKIPSCIHRLS